MPSFSRWINRFVREHMDLLGSALSFLLDDGAQLLDLATKNTYLSQQLEVVREQVRACVRAPNARRSDGWHGMTGC